MRGSTIKNTLVALAAAATLAAASATSGNAASGFPSHSIPSASCDTIGDGTYYIDSTFPQSDIRPEALATINGDGTSTPEVDEWVFFRIWVGWKGTDGQIHWVPGEYMASDNGFPNATGYGAWINNADGSWSWAQPGYNLPYIVSQVHVTHGVTYYVYDELDWSPVRGLPWLQDLEYAGSYSC